MKKFVKLFASHIPAILATLLLLVVQAYCDLTLPEYTSNIINVGIQQNGIQSTVPSKIRQSELMKMSFMMSKEESEYLTKQYGEADADGVCELSDDGLTAEEITDREEKLSDILKYPMMMLYASANMTEQSDMSFDMSSVMTPDGKIDVDAVKEMLSELDDSIVDQVNMYYIKDEYNEIGIDLDKMQMDYIINTGIAMLAYAVVAMACTIITVLLSAKVSAAFARDIRQETFKKVLSFSNNEFDKFSTASLITRCTNDIQQVQMVMVMMLRMVLYAPIVGVGAFIKVLGQGSNMSWVIAVAVGAILGLVAVLFIVALPKFQKVQKLVDRLNLVSREILTGLPVIRAFSKEEHERKRFDIANMNLTKVNLFVNRIMSIMWPTMFFIMNGVSVLIIWVGCREVDLGTMQIGDLTAFITYTMQIIMAFLMLSMMSIILPRAIISIKRIGQVLGEDSSVAEPKSPKKFDETVKGKLEFRNVSFRYNDAEEDVLTGINFTSSAGETTAIIGATGAGKSTLVKLIPRFFDVTEGQILIDNTDIRDVELKDLRNKIGYVPQKAVLFSGSIKSNIAYSDDSMGMDNIIKAAEISQSDDFINSKEDKYDDDITQGGGNVSGGQKQRLSIARAVAKNPEIYVFDDSFSALDFKTDANLRKALKGVTEKSTVVIVAQRISTVLNADRIIVIDEGKAVGIGTHAELMENCETYRQIAMSQLTLEELDGKERA